MIGQTFRNYTFKERLGDGGMGTVYRAINNTLEQAVAIKVLHPHLARNPSLVNRFRQEALIQARLPHPNVVTVIDFFHDGEICGIVMEFIRGRTFDQLIEQRGGPLPPAYVTELFYPLLNALQYAHSNQVIHRDIKPGNLILQDMPGMQIPKIMDFGIARALDESKRLTATGTKMGTQEYMSPEQCQGRSDITHLTDIYSMGVSMYEMLTGNVPFKHQTDYELMKAIITEMPPPIRQINSQVPEGLEKVIFTAMQKNPSQRFPSAGQFAEVLKQRQKGTFPPPQPPRPPQTPKPPDPPKPVPPNPPMLQHSGPGGTIVDPGLASPKPPKYNTALILGVVTIIAVAVFALVVILNNSGNNPDNTGTYSQSQTKKPTPSRPRKTSSPSASTAFEALQSYYSALSQNNCNDAASMWNSPSDKTLRLINSACPRTDYNRIIKHDIVSSTSSTATIYVMTDSKVHNYASENYCGNVDMVKRASGWKISKLRLHKCN